MATRLTNDIRESIARAVLQHRFSEAVEALVAERAAFADEVYKDIYRKADRERMAALPAGWLPEEECIGVQFGTTGRSYESLKFNGSVYGSISSARIQPKEPRPRSDRRLFAKHAHGCAKAYDDGHKLSLRHEELDRKRAELVEAFDTAKRQVGAALAGVGTIKKLIEVWPEVEPFARRFDDGPRNLPSVPTAKLNEILDLPVAA